MTLSPAPLRVLLGAAAVAAVACSLSAASAQDDPSRGRVVARVHGVSADYFEAGVQTFECALVPTDGGATLYAACSREQARDLGGGVVHSLELEPRPAAVAMPIANLTPAPVKRHGRQAATEARLHIERPPFQIRRVLGGRRRRATVVDLDVDGPRSILIIRLNMADTEVDHTTEAEARLMMQSPSADDKDVNELFQAMSYGGMSFPADRTTVVTVTSPNTGADYADGCDYFLFADHALQLLEAQHSSINPADYQHKSFFIPRNLGLCRWRGTARVGCSPNDGWGGVGDGCYS